MAVVCRLSIADRFPVCVGAPSCGFRQPCRQTPSCRLWRTRSNDNCRHAAVKVCDGSKRAAKVTYCLVNPVEAIGRTSNLGHLCINGLTCGNASTNHARVPSTVTMLAILDFTQGPVRVAWRLTDWMKDRNSVGIVNDNTAAVVATLSLSLGLVMGAFAGPEFEEASTVGRMFDESEGT